MSTQPIEEGRGLLRFLTCGSVDDGKSTLIGRLLHECGLIFEDTYAALSRDSRRHGTTGQQGNRLLEQAGLRVVGVHFKKLGHDVTPAAALRFPKSSQGVGPAPGFRNW